MSENYKVMSDIRVGPGFVFTWKIEDFMHLLKQEISLVSPNFTVKSLEETTWYLKIRENLVKSGKQYVEFYLSRYSSDEVKLITIKFELELVDVNGLSIAKNRTEHEFEICSDWGWEKFIEITEDGHISCQTVTARCTMWNESDELQPIGISRSETRLEKKRGAFTWSVKDFTTLRPENRKSIKIKFPRSNTNTTPATTLSLYLDGKNEDEKFKLEAVQHDTDQWNIFSVKMSASGNKLIDFAKSEHIFVKKGGPQIASFQSFLSKGDVIAQQDLYLPSVGLILQCEVTITSGKQIHSIENVAVNPPILELIPYFQPDPVECPLKDDLDTLYQEEFLTDVTLHVGGDSFPSHKVLLCARSPVFRAMFTSGMSEATSDSLEIADFGAKTVEDMLQYFYTDTIEDLEWNDVSQLYQIADKYQVSSLKRECSLLLKNQITTSNACDLLILSDLHVDDYLKTFVLAFISDYEQDVTRMDAWKTLEKDNLKLICEAWKYMYHKMKQV